MATLNRISRKIDADTKDWVLTLGQRETDDTLLSQVYFFVTLEYNSSAAFPGWGSKFHEMNKITEDFDVLLQQEVERCLKPLSEPGHIKNVVSTVSIRSAGGAKRPAVDIQNVSIDERIVLDIAYEDAAGREDQASFEVS